MIAATCTDKFPQMNKIPDLLGWNIYPGWYPAGEQKMNLARSSTNTAMTAAGGFCVSEYGAGANVTQHEENPETAQDRPANGIRKNGRPCP